MLSTVYGTEGCESLVKSLEDSRVAERRVSQELSQIERHLSDATNLSKYIAAGVSERTLKINRLTSLISQHRQAVAGFNEVRMQPHLMAAKDHPVREFARLSIAALASAKGDLDDAKRRYSEFTSLRDESLNLAQRLREVASRILETTSEPDVCPLCHTKFPPGELVSHMLAGVDQQLEAKGMTLISAIRQLESQFAEMKESAESAQWAEAQGQRAFKCTADKELQRTQRCASKIILWPFLVTHWDSGASICAGPGRKLPAHGSMNH